MTPTDGGPRARYREQTRGEIKEIALRQLAEGGLAAIALTRIAKELGLSGPALYRYFASRDDLASALIRDAYDDLAAAIGRAAESSAGLPPRELLRALGGAYRAWALDQPQRYLLLFGSPLPGYTAPPDTLQRSRAALGPLLRVFEGGRPGPAVLPVVRQMEAWAGRDAQVADWVAEYVKDAASTAGCALAGAVMSWTRMHGVISLEVEGQFTGMGHDPRALLDAEVDTLAETFGLD
ncbi:TetR/AcrR family transcriptional regulator [Sphaerisporangium viridialbum]|uniref:TetR/AcrR family transcriptional regulator n=1 Tax=Sphaerisporangium viridialbum TaxID=46189 RepID=UPI003C761D09